jgi:hypothetical protein
MFAGIDLELQPIDDEDGTVEKIDPYEKLSGILERLAKVSRSLPALFFFFFFFFFVERTGKMQALGRTGEAAFNGQAPEAGVGARAVRDICGELEDMAKVCVRACVRAWSPLSFSSISWKK